MRTSPCWLMWLAVGCAGAPSAPPDPLPCEALLTGGPGPTSEAEIAELVEEVRGMFPVLDGVSLALSPNTSDTSYFSANLDLTTLADPPRERAYVVNWSTLLLDDPPSHDAVIAVLGHELSHVTDYLDMDGTELAEFGVWYATSDISEYERGTDLTSMELGCAPGLIAFRVWLYDHVDAETEAQKRVDYWTPEEIARWIGSVR